VQIQAQLHCTELELSGGDTNTIPVEISIIHFEAMTFLGPFLLGCTTAGWDFASAAELLA
jgi:hypothetical protein